MVNHLTLSEEERLAGPSTVTRVNTNAFFLPVSHCIHLTLKKENSRIKQNTYLETWALRRLPSMLWVCVCVLCVGVWRSWQVWQGLDILLMEMMPSAAISVTQSPWVSITGFGGIKITRGEGVQGAAGKKDVFHVWSGRPIGLSGGSGENWHTCDYLCIRGDDKGLTAQEASKELWNITAICRRMHGSRGLFIWSLFIPAFIMLAEMSVAAIVKWCTSTGDVLWGSLQA